MQTSLEKRPFRVYTTADFDEIPQLQRLSASKRLEMKAVASVLPFRVNAYVLDELIDWSAIPDDPIYQLTFPQPGMLSPADFRRIHGLLKREAPRDQILREANRIRLSLNPHPDGQMEHNVPELDGHPLPGMQHKYRETVLFFPHQGQTCHSYCTYCFRWAQFVGIEELKFAARQTEQFHAYLRRHTELTDVIFTGGDPMIMRVSHLSRLIEPLFSREFRHIRNIRIGTKSVAYWPSRFTADPDADEVLRLFEKVVASGRHLAVMAHYSHPRELSTGAAQACVRRILSTGAVIRCQAPLVRHVNDDARLWAEMWKEEVRLGCVPYYMFVERDTGPKRYFEVPLAEAWRIFRDAYSRVTGLCRTVRGPSMSATPGKVLIQGVAEVAGEKVFVLTFVRGRNRAWVRRPFFARYDPDATWFDQLQPAFGEEKFFYEREPETHFEPVGPP